MIRNTFEHSNKLPVWNSELCLQCGWCALFCPHDALHSFMIESGQVRSVSVSSPLKTNPTIKYTISVQPDKCTGCGICEDYCPSCEKAIILKDLDNTKRTSMSEEHTYLKENANIKMNHHPESSVRTIQFNNCVMDYSDTLLEEEMLPYVKLAELLFGKRFISLGKDTKDFANRHITLLNNAVDLQTLRRNIHLQRNKIKYAVGAISDRIGISAQGWLNAIGDPKGSVNIGRIILKKCSALTDVCPEADFICKNSTLLALPSVWAFGDIRACKNVEMVADGADNVNILVFSDSIKLVSSLFNYYVSPGNAFVAETNLWRDPAQTIKAIIAADRFKGPSVIIAYVPSKQTASSYMGNGELKDFSFRIYQPDSGFLCNSSDDYEPGRVKRNDYSEGSLNFSPLKNPMPEQDPALRIGNFNETALGFTEEMALREAARCLDCRKKPCSVNGCPAHNDIPGFISLICQQDYEAAYRVISRTSSMPEICSRVCQQAKQCEGSCVRGLKGEPVAIGALERFVSDIHLKHFSPPVDPVLKNSMTVAVLGAGPAGLSCASKLADLGYSIELFEKQNMPGGVLSYGIPEFRLPKKLVQYRLEILKEKGVIIHTDSNHINIDNYDAVFICNGAGIPIRMNIPGEDAAGVISASDYLYNINMAHAHDQKDSAALSHIRNIAVVGGGNVAIDASRCAIRSGAENVYVLYRRSEEEMPADKTELKEAQAEGVQFLYLTNPTEVIVSENRASGLKCIHMELGNPDASGRRRPIPIDGSEFSLDADLVIMALGSTFDRNLIKYIDAKVDISPNGAILTDEYQTSLPGIFAAGDTITGPATVIKAATAGRDAAYRIDEYLKSRV